MSEVFIDLETRSHADLKTCGVNAYARHPSTQIMTAVMLYNGVYYVWVNSEVAIVGDATYSDVWPHVHAKTQEYQVIVQPSVPPVFKLAATSGQPWVAHNGLGFDAIVWAEKAGFSPAGGWLDSMALARSAGLPGGLQQIGMALFGLGKDPGADVLHRYMDYGAKNKQTAKLKGAVKAGDMQMIVRYNIADVVLLHRLWNALPTVGYEADVITANDQTNRLGFGVDLGLLGALRALSEQSQEHALREVERLSGGAITRDNIRSNKQVNAWLSSQGVAMPNLRREQIERFIADPDMFGDGDDDLHIKPSVVDVMRMRMSALRITGSKLDSARLATVEGRLRGLFVYHGAHTGRYTSRQVQLHNLPRGKAGIDVQALLGLYESGELTYDNIRATIPETATVDDALSALIRPMFRADEGKTLVIADLMSVECRCVAWMAGEEKLLSAFERREDVYCQMASRIYGREITKKDATERQVGKIVVLGSGYGLGAMKLGIQAANAGIDLDAAGTSAQACIDAFRDLYTAIAGHRTGRLGRVGGLWQLLGETSLRACEGTPGRAGYCDFRHDGTSMVVTLPSGRQLHYRNARIEERVPGYVYALGLPETTKPTIVYDSPRGESMLYAGKILENLSQAICRDIMATAQVRCHADGLPIVAHVHDEIVAEVNERQAEAALAHLLRVLSEPPTWARGFPVGAEGHTSVRYLKSATQGGYEGQALLGKLV